MKEMVNPWGLFDRVEIRENTIRNPICAGGIINVNGAGIVTGKLNKCSQESGKE
jgi:hypothetical protein